jgi:hypothetical protein
MLVLLSPAAFPTLRNVGYLQLPSFHSTSTDQLHQNLWWSSPSWQVGQHHLALKRPSHRSCRCCWAEAPSLGSCDPSASWGESSRHRCLNSLQLLPVSLFGPGPSPRPDRHRELFDVRSKTCPGCLKMLLHHHKTLPSMLPTLSSS